MSTALDFKLRHYPLTALLDAVLVNGYGSQPAAGWTIAYTATSKRVYTMASGGTGFSLFVDDSGPGAGTYKEARISGWVTATGLGTGTGQFPSTAQMTAPSGALVVRKSTTADSTARNWTVVADGHTVYMFCENGDTTSPFAAYPWMFGDFISYSSSDTSNCAIIGRTIENSNAISIAGGTAPDSYQQPPGLYDCFSSLNFVSQTTLSTVLARLIHGGDVG